MTYQHIAFIGKARSGKDSAATYLVRRFAFTRVAFADPLKDMALEINPYVSAKPGRMFRLSEVLEIGGWEFAKDMFPEVRRVLQHVGQTVRQQDPDFWLRIALDKVAVADRWNLPVVVTDCRYPNEAEALKARGFKLVRVERKHDRHPFRTASQHESETALDDYPTDATLTNNGTIAELHLNAKRLVNPR